MTAAFGLSGSRSLRDDARGIWQAGVQAVDSARLVRDSVQCDSGLLDVCGHAFDLDRLGRVCVVGAGKAGAGMAAGLEAALGPQLCAARVSGWVNVPADCVRPTRCIHLHAGRPPGVNEPTAAGAHGAERILDMVSALAADDLCLVLLSGGASALLPAPVEGVSLADKLHVTRFLSRSGATIEELNTVRKALSRLKGGGLAHRCTAGTLIALVISDVIGDPLDTIASGPTVPNRSTPADALAVLRRFTAQGDEIPPAVVAFLEARTQKPAREAAPTCRVHNHIIGNNEVALRAAAAEARRRGYEVADIRTDVAGEARDVGAELAAECVRLRGDSSRGAGVCLLSGGEPVVHLAPSETPQKGGRNQELVLAALDQAREDDWSGLCILSGGTDGEDGPTDAAGAFVDAAVVARANSLGLDAREALATHHSYPFFEQAGGLLVTGPTQTNVMDVRVALIEPRGVG